MNKNLREDYWIAYLKDWGDYKSDKWKTKSILQSQIRSIICLGSFTKEDLIKIKDLLERKGFKQFV